MQQHRYIEVLFSIKAWTKKKLIIYKFKAQTLQQMIYKLLPKKRIKYLPG